MDLIPPFHSQLSKWPLLLRGIPTKIVHPTSLFCSLVQDTTNSHAGHGNRWWGHNVCTKHNVSQWGSGLCYMAGETSVIFLEPCISWKFWVNSKLKIFNSTYLLTNEPTTEPKNQPTHAMKLSSSWEANSCSAAQEILSILWNLKVHYRRAHQWSLSKARWIQLPPSYCSNNRMHFNSVTCTL
jgi:hypothetical protein